MVLGCWCLVLSFVPSSRIFNPSQNMLLKQRLSKRFIRVSKRGVPHPPFARVAAPDNRMIFLLLNGGQHMDFGARIHVKKIPLVGMSTARRQRGGGQIVCVLYYDGGGHHFSIIAELRGAQVVI